MINKECNTDIEDQLDYYNNRNVSINVFNYAYPIACLESYSLLGVL